MKILAIECSAGPASVAITENGRILGNSFVNIKLTHSQTLMPMIENLLSSCLLGIEDIKGVAVSAGPGSFTGIRIGISAVKGLCIAKNLPCVAVSTLEAMAVPFRNSDGIVCAVMDARCNQVYNALFRVKGGEIERLCEDRALMCEELKQELSNYGGERIIVCGDGSDLFYPYIEEFENSSKANEQNKYQNAAGVALLAEKSFISGNTISAGELLPVYLRLPQAERELKAKQEKANA
ncbi:MAG: tRNA (adenosine(37)-N6)-threonylcarbamoyltransferase complex dimerization subunit type 1 TsaB [Clostridia bacterium]|nr:tRNA (adenosine(37)-N6)-threonylcarbamoyltransferase complex dimerization subunit type 1 TsaB [Clostridia bacterium]